MTAIVSAEKLLAAITCSTFDGVSADNVDGKNWFDARDEYLASPAPVAQPAGKVVAWRYAWNNGMHSGYYTGIPEECEFHRGDSTIELAYSAPPALLDDDAMHDARCAFDDVYDGVSHNWNDAFRAAFKAAAQQKEAES